MNKKKALRRGEWLASMRPLELAVFFKWLLRVRRIDVEARGIKLRVNPASNVGKRFRVGLLGLHKRCIGGFAVFRNRQPTSDSSPLLVP